MHRRHWPERAATSLLLLQPPTARVGTVREQVVTDRGFQSNVHLGCGLQEIESEVLNPNSVSEFSIKHCEQQMTNGGDEVALQFSRRAGQDHTVRGLRLEGSSRLQFQSAGPPIISADELAVRIALTGTALNCKGPKMPAKLPGEMRRKSVPHGWTAGLGFKLQGSSRKVAAFEGTADATRDGRDFVSRP